MPVQESELLGSIKWKTLYSDNWTFKQPMKNLPYSEPMPLSRIVRPIIVGMLSNYMSFQNIPHIFLYNIHSQNTLNHT